MWVSVDNRVFIIFCDWGLYEEEDCSQFEGLVGDLFEKGSLKIYGKVQEAVLISNEK